MHRLLRVSLVVAMFFSSSALASRQVAITFGAGQFSCGAWTEHKHDVDRNQYVQWLWGFVSGFNHFGLSKDINVAKETDGEGMVAWVDTYCAAHPLDPVASAAQRLLIELQARSHAR